jgi:hypothetical protein
LATSGGERAVFTETELNVSRHRTVISETRVEGSVRVVASEREIGSGLRKIRATDSDDLPVRLEGYGTRLARLAEVRDHSAVKSKGPIEASVGVVARKRELVISLPERHRASSSEYLPVGLNGQSNDEVVAEAEVRDYSSVYTEAGIEDSVGAITS